MLLAAPGAVRAAGAPFAHDRVVAAARDLAAEAYQPPPSVPEALAALDYDTYRGIRYRKHAAIWGRSPTRFSIELFAPGYLFEHGVDVNVVENGRARPVEIGPDAFEVPDPALTEALSAFGKLAGFRLHYLLNRSDYRDEFVVFQGASYFRAVSAGQRYGLSARGLAIDVAEPAGEEFPIFRRFWVERPSAKVDSIVVHALLDSESCAGAYRFGIYPGDLTTMDVEATLFVRRPVRHVGLAPLTSMYMHGPIDGPDVPDYRPAVHDSLGLAMHNGRGEWLWRPLANPGTLQLSAFVDEDPKGFGLIQRTRDFAHFQDLEAHYERRPSAWVAPRGEWGRGQVQLVEIPSNKETNDNILAYWRPEAPIEPGAPFTFAYRLTWPDRSPMRGLARAVRSASGAAFGTGRPQVAIDYEGGGVADIAADAVTVDASAGEGAVLEVVAQRNEVTGGLRVFVTFDPRGADAVELRVRPHLDGEPLAETWLYRWLPG